MNAELETAHTRTRQTPQPPAPFEKPRPGSWTLDAAHCERPLPRFTLGLFEESFTRGFAEGLDAYGALLERIEAATVNGFVYACTRPFGAPPEPKGLPPKPIFKALLSVHPAVRRRIRRSEAAMSGRLWRDEVRRYDEEWAPPIDREQTRLLAADYDRLDDAALADHIAAVHRHLHDAFFVHHRMNCTRVVPVGEFIASAREWSGATVPEILEVLRGCSPDSRVGLKELAAVADAIAADPEMRARLDTVTDAGAFIDDLEARTDAIGFAARAWIAKIGHHLTGFSPGYPTLRETPATLVESIRGMLASDRRDDAAQAGARALERLRGRVPSEHRAAFDALFEEARFVYRLRDHLCFHTLASIGIARIAVLEAGRRLALRGRIHEPEAALDATVDELRAMLTNGGGPDADELQRHLEWRRSATIETVPELLGPAPGPQPGLDWFPKGAVRLQRAVFTYMEAMSGEMKEKGRDAKLVRGLAASGGRRTGRARHVLEPGDFDRITQGDVLVARITTPSYNILLPMLAGIVTDRGGVLSHPAIVSREFGIPGVVGTRNATQLIPDGALVEIDGDAGTVKVLG